MKTGIGRQLDPNRRSKAVEDFERSLRHKIIGQDPAIDVVIDLFQKFSAGLNPPHKPVGTLLFLGPTGTGKCLSPGTPILMYSGAIKLVENVVVGDALMGPDSRPRTVQSLAHGWDEMYDVIPTKGDTYRVNKPHILALELTPTKTRRDPKAIEISVADYMNESQTFKHCAKGYRRPVDFPTQNVPVDPYFFGLWLGDGTSKWAEITTVDTEVVDHVYSTAAAAGMTVSAYDSDPSRTTRYNINSGTRGGLANRNPVLEGLRSLNVLENKHVPLLYKANSRETRLQVIAGLMDSDGHLGVRSPTFDYISSSKVLAEDVTYLCRSVGLAAYIKPCEKTCTNSSNGKITGQYWRVSISGDVSSIPTRIARKQALSRRQKKSVLRTGITVRPAGYGEYFGFEIDGDGLFLLGDFTVTHNTRVIEAVAEVLFGDINAFIKIDCGEFQHSHEIAKLIGSPPGYLGHRETHPVLTQDAINAHHTEDLKLTFILFDEVEKASDSLWQLMLGIMDKATLTLGDNRRVDLSSCVIAMTSNIGASEMNSMVSGGLGFRTGDGRSSEEMEGKIQRTALDAAKRKFSPEFINRIDKSVVFKTLKQGHLEQILELELESVEQRFLAGSTQFLFGCTEDVKKYLLKEGTDTKYGARHLKRSIERHLVSPFANLVATNQIHIGDFIRVAINHEDEFFFTVESENSVLPVLLTKVPRIDPVAELPEPEESAGMKKAKKSLKEAEDKLAEAKKRKRELEILMNPEEEKTD